MQCSRVLREVEHVRRVFCVHTVLRLNFLPATLQHEEVVGATALDLFDMEGETIRLCETTSTR